MFIRHAPLPYKRKLCDYKSAKTDSIRKELSNINWQSLFSNLSVNEMSLVFTGTFSQHISNKIVTGNDKDAHGLHPPLKLLLDVECIENG